jgi:hypothetical protein
MEKLDSLFILDQREVNMIEDIIKKKSKCSFKNKYGLVVSVVVKLVKENLETIETESQCEETIHPTSKWETVRKHFRNKDNKSITESDDEELKLKMRFDMQQLVEKELLEQLRNISQASETSET